MANGVSGGVPLSLTKRRRRTLNALEGGLGVVMKSLNVEG